MGINCNDSKIKRISNFPEENMLINFRCNNIKKPNQKNKNFQLYDISNDCSNLYTSFNRNKTKKVPFSTSSLGEKKQSKMKLSNQRKKKNKYFEKKIPQYFKINNIKRKSRHSKYRNSYASQLCSVVGPLDRKIDSNILNKSYIKYHLNNKTNDSYESIIESVPVRLANCPIFCGSTNVKEKYKGSKLKGKRLISCIGKGETEKDKVDRIYKNNKHEDVNKIDLNYKKNMNKLRDKSYSFTIKNKNIDENFKYLINTQITKEETKGVSNSKKAGGNIVLKGNVYKIANNHRLEENIKNENKSCEKIKKNNKHIKKRIEEYPIVDSTQSYIRDGNKISINNEKNNESSFSSFSSACSDENSSYEVSIFGELDINYDLDSNKSDTLMRENSKNMASKNHRSCKRNINRSTTKNKDIESGIVERNKRKEKCKNCDSSIKENIIINDDPSNAHKINNFNHARNGEKYADLEKIKYYETKKKDFIQNSKKCDSKRFEPAEWESRSRANRDSRSSGSSKGSVRDRCRRCIERKRDRNCNKVSGMNYKKGYKQKKEMNHEEEEDERRKKMELYLKRKIDLEKNKDKMDKYKTIYGVPKWKRIENINEPKNIETYKKVNDIKTDKIRRNSDIRIGKEIRSRNKIAISSSNDPNKIISEEKSYNNEDYNEKKKDKFYEIYFGCKKLDKINYKKGIENAKKKIYNIKIINDNSKYIREMEEDALIKNIDMQETEIEEDLHSTKYSSDMITPNDKNGNGKKYSSKYDTHYEQHYSYSSDEKDKNRLSKSHIKNDINNNWGSRKNETIGDFNEYDKGMKKKKNIEIVQSDSEHFKIRDKIKLPINLLNIQNEKNKKCKTFSHAPPKVINSVGKIMSENKRKNWKDSRNIQNLSKAKSSNLYEIILKKKKQENKNCIIDSTISSFPSTYCHIEEKGRNNYAYVCKSYETEENNYYPDANSVNKTRHIFSSINNSFKAKEDEKSKNKIKSNKKGIKNENKKNSQNLKQNKTWHTIPIEEKMFLSKSTQNSGGEIYSLNCQNSVFTFPHEYLDTSENFRSFKKSRSICSGICVGNGKDNETFRSSSDNSMTYIKKQNRHKNNATFKLRAHSINNKMKEKTNDKKINELYFYKMGENKNFRHTSNCFLSRCSPKWNKKINSENVNCYSCILKDSNKNRHQNNMCNKFNFCSEVPNEMQKINNIKIRCLSKSGTYKNEFCKNYLFSPCKNSIKTNSKNDRTKSLFSKLFSYIKKNSLCNEKKYKDSIKRNKSEAFPFCKTKKNIKPPHYICNNRSRSSGYFIDVYPIKNGVRNNSHICCCNKFMVNKSPALIHVPSNVKYIIDAPDGGEKNKLDSKLFIDKTIENEIKKSSLDLNGKAKDNYYTTKTSTNLRRGIKCDNVFTKNGITNDGYMKRVLPKGGEKRNVKGVVKKGAMKNNCKYVLKINDHNRNNNTVPCNGTTINCKTKILKNNNEHINKSISENEIDCPKIEKPNFLKLNLFDEKYETVKQSPKKMNTNNDLTKNRGAKRTSKYVSKLTKLQTMKEEGNTFRKNLNNINCGYPNLGRNRHPKSSINQITKDIDRDIFIDTNDSYIINDQIVGNIGPVCNKSGENNNEKIGNHYGKINTFDESAQMNNPNKGYKIFVVRKGDRNKSAMEKNIFSNGVIENKLPLTNSENRRGTKYVENKEHNFCKCKNDYNCNCDGINYKNNIALDSMEGETIDNYSSCSNENIYLWGNNNIIKNGMDNYRDEMINYSKEKGNNIEEIENDIKMNKPIKECLNAPLNCLNKKLNSSAENIIKKIILNYKNVNLKNMNNDKLNNHETKASVNKCINNKNFQINKKNIQKNIKNKLHLKVNKNGNNEKSDNIVNDMPNIRHTQNTDGNFVLKNNNINSERNVDIKANNNKTGMDHYKYEQFRKKNYNIINNASCSYNDCIYPDPKIYFLNNDESCIIIEYPSIKYYVVCP
ncbi:conserved Plasmodium protein, unknown function [Plasmodium chabaudi chabaudi]|uniref:Uncharacterized protein n=1 Tax=Plasmodium chabaudi chabaudi TaxID=31271 RepID=A0A4V0K2K6_PLACU|nr:conserved Plasmodium protein, unknown function [Plasmodium chabaudi chabaudi]VTZ66690.1 conserved Plasmodium protein, unknown function [Plasmodium chabaudi chabaudi]|eukprot:XP_742030.2 conserved Plasmodium protein, unknown function [Plasmodium chabaudi chabaudi]